MFNAEVFTFIAILAVVIWDVAVVQAWDPGVGRGMPAFKDKLNPYVPPHIGRAVRFVDFIAI